MRKWFGEPIGIRHFVELIPIHPSCSFAEEPQMIRQLFRLSHTYAEFMSDDGGSCPMSVTPIDLLGHRGNFDTLDADAIDDPATGSGEAEGDLIVCTE